MRKQSENKCKFTSLAVDDSLQPRAHSDRIRRPHLALHRSSHCLHHRQVSVAEGEDEEAQQVQLHLPQGVEEFEKDQ